jgi:tetratricopeptide (TPR) repeat protein
VFDDEQSMELLTRVTGDERIRSEPQAGGALVELCARLPLALRIAGARLASRPHWQVEDLVRRLSDESRRLDEFVYKGLALRSNIGLTYGALDERVRSLFRLCALIQAPDLPIWAAAALLDTGLAEGEELLDRLVEAQLLKVVTVTNGRGRRFRLHDLIRVYAHERLVESESDDARRAALERFVGGWLSLVDEAHRREYGGDHTVLHGGAPRWVPRDAPLPERVPNSLLWFERERRGLVPAIRQAASAGLHEAAWDLALTSITLFETKGYFDDWRETATIAHEAAATAGNLRGQAASRYSLGTLALNQKRLDDAEAYFRLALDQFAGVDDRHGRALVLRNAAFISRVRGDGAASRDRYREALAAMREVGDRIGEAHVMASLAKLRIEHGEYSSARRMLDAAVAICRAERCLRVEAQVVYRLAELHLATGRIEDALRALHRTLRVVRDLGDRTGEAYALLSLGVVRTREGRPDSAHTTLTHALRLAREVGDRWVEGQALFELGQHATTRGYSVEADMLLARAIELFATLDAPLWRAKSLVVRAELYADGEHAAVRAAAEQAMTLLAGLGSTEADYWADRAERLRAGAPGATAQGRGGGMVPWSGRPRPGGVPSPQCASA